MILAARIGAAVAMASAVAYTCEHVGVIAAAALLLVFDMLIGMVEGARDGS